MWIIDDENKKIKIIEPIKELIEIENNAYENVNYKNIGRKKDKFKNFENSKEEKMLI